MRRRPRGNDMREGRRKRGARKASKDEQINISSLYKTMERRLTQARSASMHSPGRARAVRKA